MPAFAQLGSRIMARVAPTSGGLTSRLQGAWMTGIAPGRAAGVVRPASSIAAVLGGSGGSGPTGNGRGGGSGGSGSGPSGGSGSSGRGGCGWGRTAAVALAGSVLLCGEAAWAAKKAPEPPAPAPAPANELTVEKVTDLLWELCGPVLTNLGFSGCVGAVAGYALKTVGKVLALAVGLLFLLVQGLANSGFITVNWTHVHGTVMDVLDVNKDGKVDHNDFKPIVNEGLAALATGVPSIGGFLAGFMLALRSF
ncbi:hypothetical protein TSOC_003466 [Tetrabaena socialis]|uniref:FUN14 domain-containing protein 1 n=1 Tax=Tetrabaena socialis TaxID=47790 RepID=A0A2J8ABI5_9CHLO|nr:hypothetical protein TSOC_003466 [Tetrabaena socialis]|eukprot:PNH09866.1 hypothetical protein TSOC_003466 [Tetrabaena socialis]